MVALPDFVKRARGENEDFTVLVAVDLMRLVFDADMLHVRCIYEASAIRASRYRM